MMLLMNLKIRWLLLKAKFLTRLCSKMVFTCSISFGREDSAKRCLVIEDEDDDDWTYFLKEWIWLR